MDSMSERAVMSDTTTPDIEVFVYKNQNVDISCPTCGLVKTVDVSNIKDISHWQIGATCKRCANKFRVSFNFRKFFRKNAFLRGDIFTSSNLLELLGEAQIMDLSLSGIGFIAPQTSLRVGDELCVRFQLDDDLCSELVKEIRIESIRGSKIGASFVGAGFDPLLGKYIMTKQ